MKKWASSCSRDIFHSQMMKVKSLFGPLENDPIAVISKVNPDKKGRKHGSCCGLTLERKKRGVRLVMHA